MKYWKERTLKLTLAKNQDKKKKHTVNNIFALDTETTSGFMNMKTGKVIKFDYSKKPEFYENYVKMGWVYIWMICIGTTDGKQSEVLYGRELSELYDFLKELSEEAKGQRMIFYVHNLSFDFQFLRNVLNFPSIFAREERKPMKAVCDEFNIEFRCSYILTNLSLEKVAEWNNLPVKKMKGDLNYNVLRTPLTHLTKTELKYCEHDVLVINYYIKQMLDEYGSFDMIPLTATGKVRKLFREHISKYTDKDGNEKVSKWNLKNWNKYMTSISEDSSYTFSILNNVFKGGFTHGNVRHAMQVMNDIVSVDFDSSYPAVMLSEKYPCSRFRREPAIIDESTWKLFRDEKHQYILEVELFNVKAKTDINYISFHACGKSVVNAIVDNGRIARCDACKLYMTCIDFDIIQELYDIEDFAISECWSARCDYLPKKFVEFVIQCYIEKRKKKKEHKQAEKEFGEMSKEELDANARLRVAKSNLNSLYGMSVTNLISSEIEFNNNDWNTLKLDENMVQQKLDEQQEKNNCFLNYSYGCFITAHARHNILWFAKQVNRDYVYIDTDSCKFRNAEKYTHLIDEYSKIIDEKVQDCLAHHNLSEKWEEIKGIGRLDNDGTYKEFKFFGAKKYVVKVFDKKKNKDIFIATIAGVNKKTGSEAIKDMNDFYEKRVFSYTESGKMTHYYIDEQEQVEIIDVDKNKWKLNQNFAICLQPCQYKLSNSSFDKEAGFETIENIKESDEYFYDWLCSKNSLE